jgi:hypothetical protein
MRKLFTMVAFAETGEGKKKGTPGAPGNQPNFVKAGQQINEAINRSFSGRGNAATGGAGRTRGR